MHRILVEEKNWISESRFLHALNYCMLLPGPEAQQLATYIGWLLHRTAGGIMAGGLFILPGIIAIMGAELHLRGLWQCRLRRGAVLRPEGRGARDRASQAVVRVGKRALRNRVMIALAAIAFVAIFFFDVPFPIIIIAAGVIGYLGARSGRPEFAAGRAWRRRQEDGRGRQPARRGTARRMSARASPRALKVSVGLAVAVAGAGRGAPDRARPGQRVQPDRAVLLARWRW